MQNLMSLIDKNAHLFPEGDYLQMCQLMKELNKSKRMLIVTPDVVGEEFIMTSDVLNKCHKWIVATESLRNAFLEHEKDPGDKVKLCIFKQIREATTLYWSELRRVQGYEELMWFIHKGTLAQRHFRFYGNDITPRT